MKTPYSKKNVLALRSCGVLVALLLLTASSGAVAQTARVQFAHASPDPALAVIDVYFDDILQADDSSKLKLIGTREMGDRVLEHLDAGAQ